MIDRGFWKNRRVFLTGHSGFKGSWLSIWLNSLGAEVTGYALHPPSFPSLFELCKVNKLINSIQGDVRDASLLQKCMSKVEPEIVIHMAAQSLVKESYARPIETYTTNVIGTVNLLESVRQCNSVRAVINVTTDKCYENKEWSWGYREIDPLGGYDPYSSSKACSEMVTASYRSSFYNSINYEKHRVAVATARAGNVIGGGDWGKERLIPDCVRAFMNQEKIIIRNPKAIRPWQHVLEPLSGYLLLAEKLHKDGILMAEAWNFGPDDKDAKPVEWIVNKMCEMWGTSGYELDDNKHVHEANYLKLDCSKAKIHLGWEPRWDLTMALEKTHEWYAAYRANESLYDVCLKQIEEHTRLP